MTNASIMKEYLVALGIKDNFSPALDKSMKNASSKMQGLAKGVKTASLAFAGLFIAANKCIAHFLGGLVKTDETIGKLAESMEISKEEAHKTHFALQAMGRSLEEIQANPTLLAQFEQLKADSAKIGIPDMSEGLAQVQAIQGEWARLKNTASQALQWVGHHLLKYLQKPMEKLRETFANFNAKLIDKLPVWTKRIAAVMNLVVHMTTAFLRGGVVVFNMLKRIFDMIPSEVKVLTGVFGAFVAFLKTGPIGKLMTLFSVLLLLLDDFFTYLDGGSRFWVHFGRF
ncbi:MAG: hypothetical protein FWG65_13170 [Turicibacter sp.]|nr:hypothetical protein [Turicibacter sp.]